MKDKEEGKKNAWTENRLQTRCQRVHQPSAGTATVNNFGAL